MARDGPQDACSELCVMPFVFLSTLMSSSWRRKKLGWFDRIYDPFKSVLFVCVLMPFFIKGEARIRFAWSCGALMRVAAWPCEVSLGTVKQCEMALSRITASLSFFIHEYKHLASYRAQVDRLYDFRCCGVALMKDSRALQFLWAWLCIAKWERDRIRKLESHQELRTRRPREMKHACKVDTRCFSASARNSRDS